MTPVTIEQARTLIVAEATSREGLTARPKRDDGTPNDTTALAINLCPNGPTQVAKGFLLPTDPTAFRSCCVPAAVGAVQDVLHGLGLQVMISPFTDATALWQEFLALAKAHGALRRPSDGPPTIGAVVHLEITGARHWYIPVAGRPGSGPFESIDGGQIDTDPKTGLRYQCIRRVHREIRGTYDVTSQKDLYDWVDAPALIASLSGWKASTTPAPAAATAGGARLGSRGTAATEVQKLLNARGANLVVDGAFGPKTEAALKAEQTKLGLPATGIADATTIAALQRCPTQTSPAASSVPPPGGTLPWVGGLLEREAKEPGFCRALIEVIAETRSEGDRLCALISEECGFNPNLPPNPIGAVGLIQWLPAYAPLFGATAAEIAKMTGIQQVRGPLRTTLLRRSAEGRADPAMAGWGNSAGAPDAKVIATVQAPYPELAPSAAFYKLNAIYDLDHDGDIEAGELREFVYGRLKQAAKKPRIGADGKPVAR